jgi:hypothetical protein
MWEIATWLNFACWGICFWWMHRLSVRREAMVRKLQDQAHPAARDSLGVDRDQGGKWIKLRASRNGKVYEAEVVGTDPGGIGSNEWPAEIDHKGGLVRKNRHRGMKD